MNQMVTGDAGSYGSYVIFPFITKRYATIIYGSANSESIRDNPTENSTCVDNIYLIKYKSVIPLGDENPKRKKSHFEKGAAK